MTTRFGAFDAALALPALVFALAFFLVPMGVLAVVGGSGEDGLGAYLTVITNPRHMRVMLATLLLSALVTLATLAVSTTVGLFLSRNAFPGRAVLVSVLTLPLAFPGVVVGFLVIILGGRQGVINTLSVSLGAGRMVFAYSMTGLFLGYLYFSIPRVLLTVMAGIEKLDRATVEAARSLGASPLQILRDVTLPALKPALIASGAVAFATAMGAFGTAFTLATDIDVLPMLIYTEFTLRANFATAAALSIVLGLVTWAVLAVARSLAGTTVAAAG
ncbi:ABC transporter permease [Acuticoccus mangrovi]|uniref:ABC transporter permease n=1 Tax=Acuticoccus mangrovi TaxID=2796142 RepID=A0A934IIP2_9HYPH|nr:ABC transporter permease [Acuticoccus mangrovi]MBJ3774422.1 ABC transporter permease [Acuticoccus mangrovi]